MAKKKNNLYKYLIIISVLAFIFTLQYYFTNNSHRSEQSKIFDNSKVPDDVPASVNYINEPTTQNAMDTPSAIIPSEYLIEVPFTSQAPLYVWDTLHEDACEEASLIMLYYWISHKTISDPQEAENQIIKLSEFEKNAGYGLSITLLELKTIAEKYYQINNLEVLSIDNFQKIKEIIAGGSPIIVGAAGKILPNPNFRNGGPNYHMLLIKGFDANGFITNDPGTRKGEDFYYKNDDLYNAIHDWDPNNIFNGDKNIMYLKLNP